MLDIVDKDDVDPRKYIKGRKAIGRKCAKCGGDYTQTGEYDREQWGNYYDENGKQIKDRYICSKCRGMDRYNETIKIVRNIRIDNLDIDSNLGKAVISQAIVAKVLGIEDLNIKYDNYGWYIDLEHINHGKIDVKSSSLQDYGRWYWYPTRKNPLPGRNKKQILCDTFVCIGYGNKRTNIDAVLIIPSKYCDVSTINYNKDSKRGNKYGIFVVDPTSYNDAHHSLMAYLKNKKYFGIGYIKEWMKL